MRFVDFHFGEIEADARERVEQHLAGCADCLREFLAVKRAIEIPALDARPSRQARARLRAAVAEEVGARHSRWSWWERPAAFAFAGATVLAAILFVQTISTAAPSMPNSLDEAAEVVTE